MSDLIVKYGLITVGAVIVTVFVVVYYLAEPNKEISFWGIKFHKRWIPKIKLSLKRVPKDIPVDWQSVLLIFRDVDSPVLQEDVLFDRARISQGISELRVREACVDMEKVGLLEHSADYYFLEERAYKIVNYMNKSK